MKSSQSDFRVKKNEPLADGLRRVFCGQLDKALGQIEERPDKNSTVHDVRRTVKKLRALLRLIRDVIGDEVHAAEDERLGAAARSIGGVRDAQMRLKTVEQLGRRFSGRRSAFVSTREILKAELARLASADTGSIRETSEKLETAKAQAGGWFPADIKWRQIRSGLRAIYKEGCQTFRKADASRAPEPVHEWRKRVKTLYYQFQLLENLASRSVKKLIRETEILGELLGEIHDLDILRAALVDQTISEERDALLSLIDLRRSKLLRAAIALGRELHAEKAKDFAARICG